MVPCRINNEMLDKDYNTHYCCEERSLLDLVNIIAFCVKTLFSEFHINIDIDSALFGFIVIFHIKQCKTLFMQ